ncbi:MAG TPA: hypothetical protein VHB02_04870 [Acidimicrobiales bacterium]|nr:hypothetical protein [Acidimicrobiales bacterium]
MTLNDYLSNMTEETEDESKNASCISVEAKGNELRAVAQVGQTGLRADIVNKAGSVEFEQTITHTQRVKCHLLFVAKPDETQGYLATHINNGRNAKGLIEKGIRKEFREQFPDLILEISPFVESAAIQAAVQQGRIDKVKLIKLEKPSDRAVAAMDKWVPAGLYGKMELDISARGKTSRLYNTAIGRYLSGDHSVFDEIVEFQTMRFDEAKVQVEMGDGTQRTFNIERPEAGHPFTTDIQIQTVGGEPTPESVFHHLRRALASVVRRA